MVWLSLLVKASPKFLASVAGLATRKVIVLAIAADPAILWQICYVFKLPTWLITSLVAHELLRLPLLMLVLAPLGATRVLLLILVEQGTLG